MHYMGYPVSERIILSLFRFDRTCPQVKMPAQIVWSLGRVLVFIRVENKSKLFHQKEANGTLRPLNTRHGLFLSHTGINCIKDKEVVE